MKNTRSDAKKFINYKQTTTTTKNEKKTTTKQTKQKQGHGMLKPVQLLLSAGVVNSMQESFKF